MRSSPRCLIPPRHHPRHAIASYIDNYYMESVGQWVAHDLRIRVYDHLHRLSLSCYSLHQTGALLATLSSDVATVQDFAPSATLSILVDAMTIIGMVGTMFWLNWDIVSTIRDADNIIVLKDGVVAEQGTHMQLLAQGGL